MKRRIVRSALAVLALSPASLFIADQYRGDDDSTDVASEVANNATPSTTLGTTPTTLIATIPAATATFVRDTYAAFGISFLRPKQWRAQTFDQQTSGSTTPVVYLSADELSDPCDSTTSGDTDCGFPIDTLTPNTPLITWTFSLEAATPMANTLIDGQPGRVESAKPGACGAIQADETIVAAVERPNGGVFYMRACLSGDQLAAAEQNVYAMLASVKVTELI